MAKEFVVFEDGTPVLTSLRNPAYDADGRLIMVMPKIELKVKRLPHAEGLPLPAQATPSSAGLDLTAATDRPVSICPGWVTQIPTGICLEIPEGFVGLVFTRSGLAVKHQIGLANGVGVVDADYRGEIFICCENRSETVFTVKRGDRLAQLIVMPVPSVKILEVEELSDTERGENGFGSTGY